MVNDSPPQKYHDNYMSREKVPFQAEWIVFQPSFFRGAVTVDGRNPAPVGR